MFTIISSSCSLDYFTTVVLHQLVRDLNIECAVGQCSGNGERTEIARENSTAIISITYNILIIFHFI